MKQLFLLSIFLFLSTLAFAQTDTVYTVKGDVLTGELKSMEKGILYFDTKYADSKFQIKWDEVVGIKISPGHILYTSDRKKFICGISSSSEQKGKAILQIAGLGLVVPLKDIVEIASLKKDIFHRLSVSIDGGLSVSKESNVRQTSASAKVNYRGDKWLLAADFSNVGTTQDDVDPINRTEGSLSSTRDIFGKAMVTGGAELKRNSELLLDLRLTAKSGLGYYIVRSGKMYFIAGAGLAVTREEYGGETPSRSYSFEGLGLSELNMYNFKKLTFNAKIVTYPSFSDPGRWRIDSDVSLKYKLPCDFYIKMSFCHNYDSKPPSEDASTNDYVYKTSIGWEWN